MPRDIFDGMRRIPVAMPESQAYKKTVNRDMIVMEYGESTVSRAEVAAIMNLLIVTGVVKAQELIDIVIQQCQRIDAERRAAANLDEDRG